MKTIVSLYRSEHHVFPFRLTKENRKKNLRSVQTGIQILLVEVETWK